MKYKEFKNFARKYLPPFHEIFIIVLFYSFVCMLQYTIYISRIRHFLPNLRCTLRCKYTIHCQKVREYLKIFHCIDAF